jgi:hypothetical protein
MAVMILSWEVVQELQIGGTSMLFSCERFE